MLEAQTTLHPEPARLTEDQLLDTAHLAAVGGLAGDVAHELNNPLFAILGLVELLLEDAEPGSKLEHRLGLIQQTGLEMKQIVRALVDFARDPGREPIALELAVIASRAAELSRRTSAARDVEIVVRTGSSPLAVEAAPAHLLALLLGLIGHARRCLPFGGTIVISVNEDVGWATACVAATGDQVQPVTFDGGAGFALEDAVADVYGGTVVDGPGCELTLRLPLHDGGTA